VRLVAATSAPLGDSTDDSAEPVRTMPDLRGQTLRQALASRAPLEIEVDTRGRGRVTAQEPRPGTPVEPGERAVLALAPGVAEPVPGVVRQTIGRVRATSGPAR
jgi:hypothetical protein